MTRPTVTVAELLTASPQSEHDLQYQVTHEGQTVTVVTDAEVRSQLYHKYYEWRVFSIDGTLTEKYADFLLKWHAYYNDTSYNYTRLYDALIAVYDPTADYTRHEQESYKNTHEVEYGKTATNTTTDLESKTEYNSTVGDDIKTYDSISVSDARSQSKTGDDTTTINGTTETALTGTDTTTDTRYKNDNQRDVYGSNTSAQSLIAEEIKLRLTDDMADIVVDHFARRYLFLLTEE